MSTGGSTEMEGTANQAGEHGEGPVAYTYNTGSQQRRRPGGGDDRESHAGSDIALSYDDAFFVR